MNGGMFHYHFKSKDNFLRALLQQMYEEMYASLQLEAAIEQRIELALAALRADAVVASKRRSVARALGGAR